MLSKFLFPLFEKPVFILFLEIKSNWGNRIESKGNYLAHVQPAFTVNAPRKGDLELLLTYPMETM